MLNAHICWTLLGLTIALHVQELLLSLVELVEEVVNQAILILIVPMDMDMVHHITTVISQDMVHTGGVIQYMINIKPYKKWQKK